LFCSPASDLLVLRVYALTSRWETSCRCSWSRTPNARPVSPTLPHLWQPVRPESERRTAIRQTVPKKAFV